MDGSAGRDPAPTLSLRDVQCLAAKLAPEPCNFGSNDDLLRGGRKTAVFF